MIPTHIIVLVRNRLDMTVSVMNQLWAQPGWDSLTFFDSGSAEPARRYLDSIAAADERVTVHRTLNKSDYETWNDGFQLARKEFPGALNVAILSNAIVMAPHAIERLAAGLRQRFELVIVYPDATGSDPVGQLTITPDKDERCFMVAAERVTWDPFVGVADDITERAIDVGAQQARVGGAVVTHLG